MPTVSFSTLRHRARQLVVHEALETIDVLLGELVVVRRRTLTVRSALSAGAGTSTRLAPASTRAEPPSSTVKKPVRASRAMSAPSALCGSFDGSRSAVTLIGPRPTSIVSLGDLYLAC